MRLNHDNLDIWTASTGGNDLTHIANWVLTNVNGQAPNQATLSTAVTALNAETGFIGNPRCLACQRSSKRHQSGPD